MNRTPNTFPVEKKNALIVEQNYAISATVVMRRLSVIVEVLWPMQTLADAVVSDEQKQKGAG